MRKQPVQITIDESAKRWFKKLLGWNEYQWKQNTVEVEERKKAVRWVW